MVVILREVVRVHVFVDAATEPALRAVAGCSMTPSASGFTLSFGMTAESVSNCATVSHLWIKIRNLAPEERPWQRLGCSNS